MNVLKKYFKIFKKKQSVSVFIDNLVYENISTKERIWAYYKLGIYSRVVKEYKDRAKESEKEYLSITVSLAKMGYLIEARKLLIDHSRYIKQRRYIVELIQQLIVYFPEEIFLIIEKNGILPNYYIALLSLFDSSRAKKIIKEKITDIEYKKEPQLLLIYSKLYGKQDINIFNKYTKEYGLKKVKLKDEKLSFSIDNLSFSNIDKISKDVNSPLVSIVMTSYNSEYTIGYAIESILKQTYKNFELIILDDNSSDDTVKIIEDYIKKDNRIILIQMEENNGTYVAKNYGLSLAKGDFVTFHDSDDYSHPEKIEIQLNAIEKDRKKVASISYWIRIGFDGRYYARTVYPYLRLNLSSLMFRKNIIDKIGYFDQVRTGADSEYLERLKLVFGENKVLKIIKPLSLGAHRESSLMNAKDTGYQDGFSVDRQIYWENWRLWHLYCKKKSSTPYINMIEKNRLFDAPDSITISEKDIENIYKGLRE